MSQHPEAKDNHIVNRTESRSSEFPNGSAAIFREAVSHIPPVRYSWQPTFAAVGVAYYMAEVQPQAAEAIVSYTKGQVVTTFPPERTKARCLMNILGIELDHDWQGAQQTLDELIRSIEEGVPPEESEGYLVSIIQMVAGRSAEQARQLVSRSFPQWEDSDIQLHIAERQANYDSRGAGQAVNEYLTRRWDFWPEEPVWDFKTQERRMTARPRHPNSKEYTAERFGWLVARYGDLDLAETMADILQRGSVERVALLGEIGARNPKRKGARHFIHQVATLLTRDDVSPNIFGRLAEAFQSTNPKLSAEFRQRYEQADTLGVGMPTSQVREILASGNLIEANNVVKIIIENDLQNPSMTYPPSGPKHDLEQLLFEVARTNPQRVVGLVDDNFSPTANNSKTHLIEIKTDILVEGAKSLIETGQSEQARELLARALVLARFMEATRKPYEGELRGNEVAIPEEVADEALMKIKAWTLAKVGAAVAKLESVSAGL